MLSPLRATQGASANEVALSGSFGVLFSGKLVAHLYDDHGAAAGTRVLDAVNPRNIVTLNAKVSAAGHTGRVSVHLVDNHGWIGERWGRSGLNRRTKTSERLETKAKK